MHIVVLIILPFRPVALQTEHGEMKPSPLSTPAGSDPPKESSAPVWTAYADGYFEGDFAAPFSDLEEEEGEESTSSGSSETASLDDNPLVTEEKPPQIETTSQPEMKKCIDASDGGQLSEEQQRHMSPSQWSLRVPPVSAQQAYESTALHRGLTNRKVRQSFIIRNPVLMY